MYFENRTLIYDSVLTSSGINEVQEIDQNFFPWEMGLNQ